MTKSAILKWAVAALLAVPAVPMFARTVHHHVLSSRSHAHRALTITSKHVRRLHHTSTAHKSLATVKHSAHRLTSKSRRHVTLSAKHTSHRTLASISRPTRVHVTKMPPTIDGIHT
jgi:hypothetical protein